MKKILILTVCCLLFAIAGLVNAQTIPENAEVKVVGGGGSEYDVITPEMEIGGGMDDFGTIYSASGNLTLNLKDVYFTDELVVITLGLGTSNSASNHISSASVYINGEQRMGGGSAGETFGEPYERTMTLVFYGGLGDVKLGMDWDNLRVSFDNLIFATYEGTDSAYFGLTEGYNWSFVFHNPEISRYDNDNLALTADERGIHTYGDTVTIELEGFSADGDLNFDLIQKSELLNLYGSQNAVWINGTSRGGGGNSVSFDEDENIDGEQTEFVQTDHFMYQTDMDIAPDSLAVWAQGITIELTGAGTPKTWIRSLSEDQFPMKIVQFYW